MAARHYDQVCGIARSLDLLGERWTLLIVRELLLGPKRFGSLEAALPGIGPNLLSVRLRSLAAAEIAERVTLDPPAETPGYALTARGEGLREPLESLALWGFDLLEPEREVAAGAHHRASWLAGTLAAGAAREGRGGDGEVVNFDVDGDRFTVRLGADRPHVRHGRDELAAGELSCGTRRFYELATGRRRSADPAVATVLGALMPAD